jgi:hypothetical protein
MKNLKSPAFICSNIYMRVLFGTVDRSSAGNDLIERPFESNTLRLVSIFEHTMRTLHATCMNNRPTFSNVRSIWNEKVIRLFACLINNHRYTNVSMYAYTTIYNKIANPILRQRIHYITWHSRWHSLVIEGTPMRFCQIMEERKCKKSLDWHQPPFGWITNDCLDTAFVVLRCRWRHEAKYGIYWI